MSTSSATGIAPFVPLRAVERPTLPRIFYHAVDRFAATEALRARRGGAWHSLSYHAIADQVTRVALSLDALGLAPGDRVALLAENRPEWAIADYAVLGLGAVTVPIYPTLPAPHIAAILDDAQACAVFVSTHAQLAKLLEVRAALPGVKHLIVFDPLDAPSGVIPWSYLLRNGGTADHAAVRHRALAVPPEATATLIYTSGTSGPPKGVILTHRNLASMVAATHQHRTMPLAPGDVVVSLLPLAHAFERAADYYFWDCGATIVYPESYATVAVTLREARPHFMLAVPRLLDHIYREATQAPGIQGHVVRWAARVANDIVAARERGQALPRALQLHAWLADRLVFSRVRTRLGGRLRAFGCGAAPLAPHVASFLWAASVPVYEGYGLTECSPALAANRPGAARIGSGGLPYPGVRLRIGAQSEILAQGPSVMRGYWQAPEATAAAIDADGWLHTGDQGAIDADGFVHITGRLKELLITSGGKHIAPVPVEERAAASLYIARAVLIADRRPYPIMLVEPASDPLRGWAVRQRIATADPARLYREPRVRALLEREVQVRVQDLAPYERPRRVIVLSEPLTIDSSLLTPTLKVKRQAVAQRYAELIEATYRELGSAQPANKEHDDDSSAAHDPAGGASRRRAG